MKLTGISRYHFIGYLFTLIGVMIFIQMVRIQNNVSAKNLSETAQQNYDYEKRRIIPERGNIYDRWGHLLAGNKEIYEVGVDLRYAVYNAETIAAACKEVLGLDYNQVLETIMITYEPGKREYAVLVDFVPGDRIEELSQMKENYRNLDPPAKGQTNPSLNGLLWVPHLQRSYPENSLASNILGFFSFRDRENGAGFFGVEEKYNGILAGKAIDIIVPRDPYQTTELPSVPPGSSLVLTIDREIQSSVEKILDRHVSKSKATSGTIIVMDPKTGDILAMATTPRLNPNEYWKYEELFPKPTPYNRAVGQTYEPGSVFKVLTMAAALDSKAVTPYTPFLDTGSIEIGGTTIYNWDREAWGPQNMTTCMQHSLNVCLTWIAIEVGSTRFYEYMQAFGLDRKTNIDLAGEVVWPLAIPGDSTWYPINLGTNSFGQGIAVTPIQMTTAVAALANDGKMMAPHILQSVIENGRQFNNTPQQIGQPISAKTAREISNMLAISLEEEASTALVPGYRVAGKTGTGEIPGPYGYLDGLTNASFVGWGPLPDSKFVVYIWLEEPRSSIWGSIVAAPVFSDVVQSLVVSLNIPPDPQLLAAYEAEMGY
jgi:cell division protein FtsI/penicillin-binding protein 2